MANTCYTTLSIQKTDNTTGKKDMAEMSEEIQKFINEEIAYCGESYEDYTDEDLLEFSMDTKWNVPTEKIQELCKKFSVQVRAVGREDGMGFIQVVCVEDDGNVLQDDALEFKF